jgi:PAS domain S-box-containing protein
MSEASLTTPEVPSFGDRAPLRDVSSPGAQAGRHSVLGTLGLRAATADLQSILDDASELIGSTLDADLVAILELVREGELVVRAGRGWSPGVVGRAVVPASSNSHAGHALRAGVPVIVSRLSEERRFTPSALLLQHGAVSGVSTIVPGRAGPFGILDVHTRTERVFSYDDVQFLGAVAGLLASAVERERALEAVRQSDIHVSGVLESMSEGVIVVGEDGLILYANARIGAMFGYEPEALMGRPIELLVPEDLRAAHAEHRHGYFGDPRTRTTSSGPQLFGRRRDGSEIPIQVGLSSVRTDEGLRVTAVVSDVSARLRTEQELRESRALFRDLVEDLSIGVIVVDASREIRTANRAAWTLLGLDKRQLVGRRTDEAPMVCVDEGGRPLPPNELPVARAVATGEPVRGVVLGITSDGREPLWVIANAEPRLNVDGSVREVIFIYQDIGDLHAAERGLAEAEIRFRSLVEQSPAVVFVRDLTATPPRLTYVSPQVERVLGYSQERFTAEPELWLAVIHPEDKERAGLRGPSPRDRPAVLEHRLLDAQGRVVWVRGQSTLIQDVTGRSLAEQGFFVDVTDEKLATSALRESEAFAAGVFRSAREAMFVFDLDLRLRSANPFVEEITGWSVGALGGSATLGEIDFLAQQSVAEAVQSALGGTETKGLEVAYPARGGGRGWLSLTVGPLRDDQGRVTGGIVSGQEVTDRKEAEAVFREQSDRLAQQARMLDLAHMLVRDTDDRITVWNRGAVELYGFTESEAVGRVSHELLRTRSPANIDQIARELGTLDEWSGEQVHVTKDDREIVVASHQVVHRDDAGRPVAIVEVNNDITATKRAQGGLARMAGRLETLHEIDREILARSSIERVAREGARRARRLVGADRASVAVRSAEGLVVIAADPEGSDELLAATPIPLTDWPLPLPSAGTPLLVNDLAGERGRHPGLDDLIDAGYRSALSTALSVDGEMAGSLSVLSRRQAAFAEAESLVATEIADELSLAVHHLRLIDELEHRADELGRRAREHQELLARIVTAQEDERARVARELHDSLGGTLTSLTLFAAILEKELSDPEERERVHVYRTRVENAIGEMRALVTSLRPPELDEGLSSALRRLATGNGGDDGLLIRFEDGMGDARLTAAVEASVYRVVQEALGNAIHHAKPNVVSISVSKDDDMVTAIVEDDGRGFDPELLPEGHFGVIGMRERAMLAGGVLTVDSAPGRGTVVRIEVPV